MSFRYKNFTKVGTPNSNSPQMYSYITKDPISLIITNNYFSDERADILVGDMIYVSVIGDGNYLLSALNNNTVIFITAQPITGWASYVDTQYQLEASPFTALADVITDLPNNSGTIFDSQKPLDVLTFYDGTVITGRDGDQLDVMLYFQAVPSVVNQWIEIYIDIGGGIGALYRQTFAFPRGAGITRGIVYGLPSAYTGATWQANGGTIKILSNANVDIFDINYNFDRSHKAR
tara:strand:- start:6750 stop:7448 length:699 start_codon:yes stop_codon:yes gene_type:complete